VDRNTINTTLLPEKRFYNFKTAWCPITGHNELYR
jgi:hypothetical protein